jgi:hypothetical protein
VQLSFSLLDPVIDVANDIVIHKHTPDFIQGTFADSPHAKQQSDTVGNRRGIDGDMVSLQTIQYPGGQSVVTFGRMDPVSFVLLDQSADVLRRNTTFLRNFLAALSIQSHPDDFI